MTATLTEEATLDWLDFAVTCSMRDCDQAADWWIVCLACAAHIPWCEPHRAYEVLDNDTLGPRARIVCSHCKEGVRAPAWRSLFAVIPIGRT